MTREKKKNKKKKEKEGIFVLKYMEVFKQNKAEKTISQLLYSFCLKI